MNYQILSEINDPKDLKKLDSRALSLLAQELRHRIIDVLSQTGGHLASNLGVVELTLALHYVFDSPSDKLIWDVSHQTYIHKLLTGRNDLFPTIRQTHGLSGFSNPKESLHDHFYAGHAGTALSLALGVAKQRDLCKEKNYVIPIIGDATLTCGMSLEALNNISRDIKKFIVILNDNEMSISKNVGAITRILSRMLSNPRTTRLYQELDGLLTKIPGYGALISQQGHRITESIKHLFSPAVFFENFGLSYIGPIDGHNINEMIQAFEGIKNSNWPVFIHVLTKKGQGMNEALNNPSLWHGAKPFSPNTGKFLPTTSDKPTFPKIFGKHLLRMARTDESIVAITPAMSQGSCLDLFVAEFPDRCLDVGIAEAHSVTYAGGVAYGKKHKVFSSVYSTFLQRGFDNVFHDVCLQELNVVFAIDRAGIAGGDGQTHNGIYDISFLNAMPNMVITQPRDGDKLKDLLESAHGWNLPTSIRYPNMETTETERERIVLSLGKGEVLKSGSDVLIVAVGHMSELAFEISERLSLHGIQPTIVDPVFIKPLDEELFIELLKTHSIVVTLEEHSLASGFGILFNSFTLRNGFYPKVLNFGVPEIFVEQGKYKDLLKSIGLAVDPIYQKLLKAVEEEVERKNIHMQEVLS